MTMMCCGDATQLLLDGVQADNPQAAWAPGLPWAAIQPTNALLLHQTSHTDLAELICSASEHHLH